MNVNKMTFNQLRDELMNCDGNPVKELLIRKLMKEKYLQLLERRRRNEYIKDQVRRNEIRKYNRLKRRLRHMKERQLELEHQQELLKNNTNESEPNMIEEDNMKSNTRKIEHLRRDHIRF
jgi:mannitol-1-phosphate/altronate dehydrogenase